ncbi:uncharacterized protein YbcI [Salirhabdus euzebyi]|uniref:Uncharacterized protein YbcI n=1 Tax=Salirhabdus euzebyi TaxID=394506 RepID=A0A841Q853_9BACI|nr:Na-translocating system protein MpsC family protein [Salirhabdus euzebyi]MBB6454631.1 uncharacterized protein YbcI [Salirhabdus euzebyi]
MEQKNITADLSNYISKMLRDNFGKGPENVYVSIGLNYITFYLKNFLSPTEKVLMQKDKENTVQETRDTVMSNLIPQIQGYIKVVTGMEINYFFYDWGLHNRSGMMVGLSSDETQTNFPVNENYKGKEQLEEEIVEISKEAQKTPENIYSCQLNPRTILIIRNGILVRIEKEIIRMGFQEHLRIAKRKLEKQLLHNNTLFNKILETKVSDVFVDWDFDVDKSVILLIMNPNKPHNP